MIVNSADRLAKTEEYYFSVKLKEIAELNKKGHQIINLGIGSPDLPPHKSVISELTKQASLDHIHGYQSYQGIPEFRKAISEYSNKYYDIDIDADTEILPLIGSKEGIMHIAMAFLNPGDQVLIPNPGYPTYTSIAELLQCEIFNYNLLENNHWNIDIAEIKKFPLDDIKLLWINYPNMPTGATGDQSILKKLITLAKKHRFLIVNDNPYNQLFTPPAFSIFQIEGAKEVAIELNSMSKSHNMAGWRLGWVTGRFDYIKSILKVKSNMDSGMFLPIQKAAVKALALDDDYYKNQRKLYSERRAIALQIFDALGCNYNKQEGMFLWARIPDNIDSIKTLVDNLLMKAGVFIVPGFIFGNNGDRYLRISLCSSVEKLKQALGKIKTADL